jgi:hypothetical protein
MLAAPLGRQCPLLFVCLYVAQFAFLGGVAGAPPPLPHDPASVSADTRLTFLVRRALLDDETLAPFNIGVQVREGTATLIGRVPTKDLSEKAETCARQVPGVRGVQSELLIGPATERSDLPHPVPAPPFEPQRVVSLFAPVPISPDEDRLPATATGFLTPFSRHDDQPVLVHKPQGQLAGISAAAPLEPLRAVPDSVLLAAVERLCSSETRFGRVQTEVHNGTITLRGPVERAEDGMDLARKVARFPGVTDVILRTRESPTLPGRTP